MHLFQRISLTLSQKISVERQRLQNIQNNLYQTASNFVSQRRRQLELLQMRVAAADPARILGNGFAIVAVGGKRACAADIVEGARVKLVLRDGEVEFTVGEVVGKKNYMDGKKIGG